MSLEPSFRARASRSPRMKALVVCAHLRPGRDKRRTTYLMQPIAGLHVASLIDQSVFDVRLHHEDWHGPLEVATTAKDTTWFSCLACRSTLTDCANCRFTFAVSGAVVVAGGSICTTFPEFASQFFDAVCAGGVDSVPAVVAGFSEGFDSSRSIDRRLLPFPPTHSTTAFSPEAGSVPSFTSSRRRGDAASNARSA